MSGTITANIDRETRSLICKSAPFTRTGLTITERTPNRSNAKSPPVAERQCKSFAGLYALQYSQTILSCATNTASAVFRRKFGLRRENRNEP